MRHLSLNQTSKKYEGMLGRKISESVETAEVRYQAKKAKRYRSAFTTGQINYLEKQFQKFPYIGNACRKEVASVLNIPERAVKIWFQNRRMKEKKETTNREYNLDRQNISINNAGFGNDPLYNNGHSLQSANDRHCSLQFTNHVNKVNYTNYNVGINKSDEIKLEKNNRETVEYGKLYQFNHKDIKNEEKQGESENKAAVNLSNCNLNRVYNNSNFVKYLEKNKNEAIGKSEVTKKIKVKESNKFVRQSQLNIPCSNPEDFVHPDMPEDLSARNKPNAIIPQNHQQNIHLSSSPFCDNQNYLKTCISTGNIIWNPINVMPVISTQSPNSIPITVNANGISGLNLIEKNNCNCNCHTKNVLDHQRSTLTGISHPQYVIAIPINKNS